MSNETPYQAAPQLAQLRAERENAVAYGMKDRVAAVDKQLAELGVKAEAAEKRQAAAKNDESAQAKAPQGRSTPQDQEETTAPAKRGPGRPRSSDKTGKADS